MFTKAVQRSLLALVTTVIFTTPALAANPDDPYESFNRVMFNFNEAVDKTIIKPLAKLYNSIIPKPLARGFTNFYNNIDTVPTILNDALQGNFYQATSDTWRLGINSTFGILGFFDVAERIGLEPNAEDFGLTLARWGFTQSNYLVLPLLGPGTVRDFVGFPINYYFLSIYPYINPTRTRYELYFFGVLVRRADLLRYESLLQELSIDKYAFMRDAYFQHRNYLIERNTQLGNPYLTKNKLEEATEVTETAEENKATGDKNTGLPAVEKAEIATTPFSDI